MKPLEPIGLKTAAVVTSQLWAYFPALPNETRDPDAIMQGVRAILAEYPPDVVEAVVSPTRGLPAKHKFFPQCSEVKEECERWSAELRSRDYRRQVEDTTRQLAAPDPKPRPSMDDLRTRYGSNWGLTSAISTRKASFRPVGEIVEEWRKQREQANIQANSGAEGSAD